MTSFDDKVARYRALRAQNRHLGRPRTGRQKACVYREGAARGGRVKCPALPVVLVWPDRDGRIHQGRFADEESAYMRLAELRGAGLVGQRAAGNYTFAEYAKVFLVEREGSDIKASTLKEDRRRLKRDLIPVFGQHELDRIDRDMILEYRRQVLEKCSVGTWNRLRALLSSFFTSAYKGGHVQRHPIKGLVEASHEPELDLWEIVFSEPEQAAVLRACGEIDEELRHPFIRDFCLVGFDTAARPGTEIAGLRWRDVAFSIGATGTITFRNTKSRKDRIIEMTERLRDTLLARYETRGSEVYVFPGLDVRRPLCNYKAAWRRALARAGVRYRKPYSMRHTSLTNLAMAGMSAPDLRDFAGHSSITVTMRYLHAARAVAAMARGILGAIGEPVKESFSRTLTRTDCELKSG